MNDLLLKLIAGENVDNKDIEMALHEICCDVHSGCDSSCPVYRIKGDIPWDKDLENCICFKDGKKMMEFIKSSLG